MDETPMMSSTSRNDLFALIASRWTLPRNRRGRSAPDGCDYIKPEKREDGLRSVQGHHPCPVCKRVMIACVASRCFRCGQYDREVFDELDRRIAAHITEPRARL